MRRLIESTGLKRYAFYLGTSEGREMPNGDIECSGYVINEDGRVYFFWTAWDDERKSEKLDIWRETRPEPLWLEDPEYRVACESLGLTS